MNSFGYIRKIRACKTELEAKEVLDSLVRKHLIANKEAVTEVPSSAGLSDPAILNNTIETLIYGISNISIENGGASLRVCHGETMSELRAFVSKTLNG